MFLQDAVLSPRSIPGFGCPWEASVKKIKVFYADWSVVFYNEVRRSPILALSGIVLMRNRRSHLAFEAQTVYDE
jgi:hypothetical protein